MSKRSIFVVTFLITCFCLTLHGSAQSPQYINFVLQQSPNGEKIAIGTIHGEVVVYDAASQITLQTFQSEDDIYDLRWSPDGDRIATVSYLGSVSVWSIESRQLLLSLDLPLNAVFRVNWSPDGSQLAITSAEGGTIVLSAVTGGELYYLQTGSASDSDWSPSEKLITADLVGLRIWENQTPIAQILGTRNGSIDGSLPSEIALPLSADRVALYGTSVAEFDGTGNFSGWRDILQIYAFPSLDLLYSIALSLPEQTSVMRMEWSEDGQHIAVSTTDGYVQVWDASLQFVGEVFIGNAGLAFDWIADNKIVSVTDDMTLQTFEIAIPSTIPMPNTAQE